MNIMDENVDEDEGESPMSASVTVEDAQANLTKLIGRLSPGEEIVITQNQQPVAKLIAQSAFGAAASGARQLQGDDHTRH